MTREIDRLIDASSLGTPEAQALRGSVPDDGARAIVERSKHVHLDDPTPTTGAPYGGGDAGYDLPAGCRCYWREYPDWGEVRTPSEGGCPVHDPNRGLLTR